jgi:hypothetical protein
MSHQQPRQPWSAGQPSSSIPRRSSISYPNAQGRSPKLGRRRSRVRFDDQETHKVNQPPQPPRDDPYNPRWHNAIYDRGTEYERAPVDDNHRPSAATLVDNSLEPPLDRLGDFMHKPSITTSFSSLPGIQRPPEAYAPGQTPPALSKKKRESRTVLERRRRASICKPQVERIETPEDRALRLEKEKRRGLPANHRELYGLPDPRKTKKVNDGELGGTAAPLPKRLRPQRPTSEEFDVDILLDERDPRFTGKITLDAVIDRDEIELERLKKMTFAQRMSEKEKDKIRFHIVCKKLYLLRSPNLS